MTPSVYGDGERFGALRIMTLGGVDPLVRCPHPQNGLSKAPRTAEAVFFAFVPNDASDFARMRDLSLSFLRAA